MAKVTRRQPPSAKMQRIVDLSSVRSGVKREFAFALKAQMEMLISPKSCTRSGTILHSRTTYQKQIRKRRRKLEPPIGVTERIEEIEEPTVPENFAAESPPNCNSNAAAAPSIQITEEIPPKFDDSAASGLDQSLIQIEPEESASAVVQNVVSRNWNGKQLTYFRRFKRFNANSGVDANSGMEQSKAIEEVSPIPAACSAGTEILERGGKHNDERETYEFNVATEERQMPSISLTKTPSNAKNLLRTGLLEGINVKYIFRSLDEQEVLRGVVRNGRILCFCHSCKGLKIVPAQEFEIHAGSTNRHPSDHIFLENGRNLRDVIRACIHVPLDALEFTIRRAISADPPDISQTKKLTSARGSCLGSRLSPRVAKRSPERASTTRKTKPKSLPSSPDLKSWNVTSPTKSCKARMTTKDLRLHKLVFTDGILPDGTEVAYYARGKMLLQGYIKQGGIFCHCCNTVISPSQFEVHAGCPTKRKPYLNIYTSNGVSLHELAISLSKGKKFSAGENDDLCGICADGGDLLLCDICPRAFHKECLGLTCVPRGDWYCPQCQNTHQKEKFSEPSTNAIAAGRIAGVDPIQQIIQRCIRIVKTPEYDIGGCVLCSAHDFSKNGFGPRTVLLCDQCEREYHVGCLKDHDMGHFKELPKGQWFCSPDCRRIKSDLQRLLTSGPELLTSFESNIIFKKCSKIDAGELSGADISWKLLRGKSATSDSRLLLSKALSIFRECFDPIIDGATGKDLIPALVYGRDMREQEFGGIYCSVLTVKSSVVSAGLVRILGSEVAELPLVATSREYQGQGFFQALFASIERMLNSLGVKHLVLPAAEEAISIWTNKFGFTKFSVDQLNELAKGCRPTTFFGTTMLYKLVSNGLEREAEGKPAALSLSSPQLSGADQ